MSYSDFAYDVWTVRQRNVVNSVAKVNSVAEAKAKKERRERKIKGKTWTLALRRSRETKETTVIRSVPHEERLKSAVCRDIRSVHRDLRGEHIEFIEYRYRPDLDDIANSICAKAFGKLLYRFQQDDNSKVLMFANKCPVAVCAIEKPYDYWYRNFTFLYSFGVIPGMQRKGYGTALVDFVKTSAASAAADDDTVDMFEIRLSAIKPAVKFYVKSGFYHGGFMNEYDGEFTMKIKMDIN